MTPLEQAIMRELRQANALTSLEIAAAINEPADAVQAALHSLDDAGCVIMRNGFYRLSEAARCRSPCTNLKT